MGNRRSPQGSSRLVILGRFCLGAIVATAILLFCLFVLLRTGAPKRSSRSTSDGVQQYAASRDLTTEYSTAGFRNYLDQGSQYSYELKGNELTGYVKEEFGNRVPAGISNWEITLVGETVRVEGLADLEVYFEGMGLSLPETMETLTGDLITFTIDGRLKATAGAGTYVVERVRIGALPLPLAFIEQIASSRNENNDQSGSVLIQRFELPPGIDHAILRQGRITING